MGELLQFKKKEEKDSPTTEDFEEALKRNEAKKERIKAYRIKKNKEVIHSWCLNLS